ncbi:MAG: FAD-dependent thymidylate synthase [Candidatus Omnitrophica bacterium]|nr:FAD-dependent thymidylate synthase [Candidatus Omnitrophota bacterium]MDD5654823.1 FAD-dependent thymidylate synthase [Candidatus Omnitrophota bacterium]
MPQVELNVKLLEMSEQAVPIIYAACRQCYSQEFAGQIFSDTGRSAQQQEEFVRKVVASGHESPLEHVKFTFAVEGVSRALTHQLVRHRLASYSQQSQRYVKEKDFDYIVPPSIDRNPEAKKLFDGLMSVIQEKYTALLKLMGDDKLSGEAANQDARFVLPQAAETKIVLTMNCRELIHFFKHRCCTRAQWEIRELASRMLKICNEKLPAVFSEAGAKCVSLGYCPEGDKFCCGKYPVKDKVFKPA